MKALKHIVVAICAFATLCSLFMISCAPPSNESVAENEYFDWSGLSAEYETDSWRWSEKYMAKLIHSDLFSRNDFAYPYEPISRGEFIHWLNKILNFSSHPDRQHPFLDLSPEHPYYYDILGAYETGIISDEEYFHPDLPLLRYLASQWLARAKDGTSLEASLQATPPYIFAQDGQREVEKEYGKYLSFCFRPDHQLLYFRWRSNDFFRYVEAGRSMNRAEAAYSLYQLKHPPVRGGSLAIGLVAEEEPYDLFCWSGIHNTGSPLQQMVIAETISRKDQNWSHYPVLLEQVPTMENGLWTLHDDGRMELRFNLRKGLTWSDGNKITSHDAVAFYNIYALPAFSAKIPEYLSWIDRIETLDDYSYTVFWSQPFIHANRLTFILPLHFLSNALDETAGPGILNSYAGFPLHAGPYFLKSWDKGEKMLFQANPFYVMGQALIDTVEVFFFENNEKILEAMLEGSIDLTWNRLDAKQTFHSSQKNSPEHLTYFTTSFSWEHLDLSLDHATLSDIRVRQALLYGIDRKSISEKYFGNTLPLAHGWLTPGHPATRNKAYSKIGFDPMRANQLLDDAGWNINPESKLREKNGEILAITLVTTSDKPLRVMLQQDIAHQWKQLKIEVQLKQIPSDELFSYVLPRRTLDSPSAILFSWSFSPESTFYTILNSSMIPSQKNQYLGQNYTGFSHPLVDELTLDNFRQLDLKQIYHNTTLIHGLLLDELPALPLFFYPETSTVNARLQQYVPSFLEHPPIATIAQWYWKSDHVPFNKDAGIIKP